VARANRNRERISLLEKYLDDREDVQARLYQLLKFGADLRLPHNELERLLALVKPLGDGAWAVEHELEDLRKGK
jgi:hypothetical protein